MYYYYVRFANFIKLCLHNMNSDKLLDNCLMQLECIPALYTQIEYIYWGMKFWMW